MLWQMSPDVDLKCWHPCFKPSHPMHSRLLQAKAGAGSATLSMAQAAARFAEACLRAMGGEPGVVECAYVASSLTDLPYFASPLRLGPAGIEGACTRGPGRVAGAAAASCVATTGQTVAVQPWRSCSRWAGLRAGFQQQEQPRGVWTGGRALTAVDSHLAPPRRCPHACRIPPAAAAECPGARKLREHEGRAAGQHSEGP